MEEAPTAVETGPEQKPAETREPIKNSLFGAIGYADDEAYEKFIHNLNASQAILILMAAANFAQAKGAFSMYESEALATSVRLIKKTATVNKKPDTQ